METKPQQLFLSSLAPLPWFYKCHQILPLQFRVNKGKIKGGRGFSSLPPQDISWKHWIYSLTHMLCSLWDLFFSRFYSAKQLQSPKPPRCVQLVKPASSVQPSKHRTAAPSPQPGRMDLVQNCSFQQLQPCAGVLEP